MNRSFASWISVLVILPLVCGGCSVTAEWDESALGIGGFEAWAEPIPDAIKAGEAAFEGDFDRGITTLRPFEGRLWMGYGDATRNLGSEVPVEFRWFAGCRRSGGPNRGRSRRWAGSATAESRRHG